jgi:hypothetical protein
MMGDDGSGVLFEFADDFLEAVVRHVDALGEG